MGSEVKNPPAMKETPEDSGLIPGLERFPRKKMVEEMATHSSFLAWGISWTDTSAGGCGWDQSQGAARPGRPAAAQRTGGGEGGLAGPARTPGLRKQPVGTSGAWPLQSPLYQGARTKEGSCLVPLFRRKKNWAQKPGRPPYLMLGCSTYKLPTNPAPGPG